MNIVKELRKKKGIQQKELAIEIGVSRPTVSEWESGKKDPSGERLKRLAQYFDVDELVVLGKNVVDLNNPQNLPETEQIKKILIEQIGTPPKTDEAKIISRGIDRLPKEKREQALNVLNAMFSQYEDLFQKGDDK